MDRKQLIENIKRKKSYLCIGLDTDISKIPENIKAEPDPIFSFNKAVVDATVDLAVCYKPNIAFYESYGLKGWTALEKTAHYIKNTYPDIFLIADAKRGDIGNTSKMYAHTFFEKMDFDAITVSPYMGRDSVEPFFSYQNKWIIILALTSNAGSEDFQQVTFNNEPLYEIIIRKSLSWGSENNTMYVVGATKADKLEQIRNLIPDHFLLIPGVGAQGGSLSEVSRYGLNNDGGILVNASRSVIYAGNDTDFAEKARDEAMKIQSEMSRILQEKKLYL